MREAGQVVEKPVEVPPWRTTLSKEKEELSLTRHQERVERYHKIRDLSEKKVDTANIARQVGSSRRAVYWYLAKEKYSDTESK